MDLGWTGEKFLRVDLVGLGGRDFFGLEGEELRVSGEGFEKNFERVIEGNVAEGGEYRGIGGRVEFGG